MTPGVLDVELVRGRDGRTRLGRSVHQFPQRITVPMYLDEDSPGRAHLCVQNPSAGVFPGDRLTTRILAGAGTSLYLTSQSATQVFAPHAGSESTYATAAFDFAVSAGAVLAYFPKSVIPHSRSDYRQSTTVTVEGDGVYLGWESVAAGRIGHGERYRYRRYEVATEVACDGRICARDRLVLQPTEADVIGPGLLNGRDYLATLTIVAPAHDAQRLLDTVSTAAAEHPDVQCGASALPGEVGVLARVLADRAPALARFEQAVRTAADNHFSGRTARPATVRM